MWAKAHPTPEAQITVGQILGNEGSWPKRSDVLGPFAQTHLQDGFKPGEGLSGGKDLADGPL